MEMDLRAALIDWLRDDPALASRLNSVTEEAPPAASPPTLAIAASASADWSTKDRRGREVRIALELTDRGADPAGTASLADAIERRVAALPPAHGTFHIASTLFLRARAERRPRALRSVLIEYRFRILETLQGDIP